KIVTGPLKRTLRGGKCGSGIARHSGVVGFPEEEDAHERVVAAVVEGTGPACSFAGGVDVLDEVETEEWRDAFALIDDGFPWNGDFAAPEDAGGGVHFCGVANAGAFDFLPGPARVEFSLD